MEKLVKLNIITIINSKKLEIIINLNKNITFDYLLEYLSYGYPQENLCPCYQFIDFKKTRYIQNKEKVIDLIGNNKNTFYISNPNQDKACHCSDFIKKHYIKSKLELIAYIDEITNNYKIVINGMNDEIAKLEKENHTLKKAINDPETIDKLNKIGIKGDDLKPRENLATIDPNNNQIIVNDSVNEKKFIDFYDVIIDIKSIKDICNGWEIKMSEKGKQNYEKYKKNLFSVVLKQGFLSLKFIIFLYKLYSILLLISG